MEVPVRSYRENRIPLLIAAFVCLIPYHTEGQSQLSVPVEDPVYSILEICSIRGILPQISRVRPYSKGTVESYMHAIGSNASLLTDYEKAVLDTLFGTPVEDEPVYDFYLKEFSDFRVLLSQDSSYHSVNLLSGGLMGTIGPSAAYNFNVGIFLDKVDPETFPPFTFTKLWDGFHIRTADGTIEYSTGENDHLNFSYNAHPEMSLDLADGLVNLRLARFRREWGVGDGSLSFSRSARPMEAFEGRVSPDDSLSFYFFTGVSGDWWNPYPEQKMFSIHRLEYFPAPWLYLSAWESAVWAKRLEFSYINPIMPYFIGQQIIGDLDNIALGGDFAVTISPYFRLYFSIFIDEIDNSTLFNGFFRSIQNQYAWHTGVKVPIPFLPFSLFTFQYTKIEPYCYTHYPQPLPHFTNKIFINYAHDGENIGYQLPPNSDEFLVKFFIYPLPRLTASLQYKHIRHGSGDHTNGQIEGDVDIWIDYSDLASYPDKDFLNDGIYERIHMIGFALSYSLPSPGITVRGDYNFVSIRNYQNIPGNDVLKNLFGIGIRISIF